MNKLLFTILLFVSTQALGQTILNPGPGYPTYINHSCGGVKMNEYADGFDALGNPETIVVATTACPVSGRGGRTRQYLSCWSVVFNESGAILSRTLITSADWIRGDPPTVCAVSVDPNDTFTDVDGDTLETALIPLSGYRAILTLP